jgi:hypothetical protein
MNAARRRRFLIKKRALESKKRGLEAEKKEVRDEIAMYEAHALVCRGQKCFRNCPTRKLSVRVEALILAHRPKPLRAIVYLRDHYDDGFPVSIPVDLPMDRTASTVKSMRKHGFWVRQGASAAVTFIPASDIARITIWAEDNGQ